MKRFQMTFLTVMTVFLLAICGCSENGIGPEEVDYTGQWSGSIDHPGYDSGTLTVNLVQSGETLSGTYQMSLRKALANGRTQVSNFGGEASGGKRSDRSGMNLSIEVSGSDWICQTSMESDNSQNGSFTTARGISGDISLAR